MLDLTKVATQIDAAVNRLRASHNERQTRLDKAQGLIVESAVNFSKLKQKIEASRKKTTWLIAEMTEPPSTRYPAPSPTPAGYSVIATDGSQIDVDRHQSVRCCLINIGQVRLDYGRNADAELASIPKLCVDKADMFLSDGLHEQAIEGALLGIKRTVAELNHLAEMSAAIPPERSTLALVDGSLLMWGLASEKYPDFVSQELLENGYLKAMGKLHHIARSSDLALASYISFTRATDVTNALRLLLCPEDVADCDKHCKNIPGAKRPCEPLANIQDSDLFGTLLDNEERSAVFCSQSRINERYGPHCVHFFYLKFAGEVSRVEIPEWVVSDGQKLRLTHQLVIDQCRRGGNYPVALAEAHEQAVVTGADHANFQEMLDNWLIAEHLPQATSAKSQSKRMRWI